MAFDIGAINLVLRSLEWLRKQTRTSEIDCRVWASHVQQGRVGLEFSLRNEGKINFSRDGVRWHVFVDQRVELELATTEADDAHLVVNGMPFVHFNGGVDGSLFPSRSWGVLRLVARVPLEGEYEIRWFVSAEDGLHPKTLRRLKKQPVPSYRLPVIGRLTPSGFVGESPQAGSSFLQGVQRTFGRHKRPNNGLQGMEGGS